MDMGKFQGVMAPTTPTGCLIVIMRLSRPLVSSTSPQMRFASSANHSTEAALQGGGGVGVMGHVTVDVSTHAAVMGGGGAVRSHQQTMPCGPAGCRVLGAVCQKWSHVKRAAGAPLLCWAAGKRCQAVHSRAQLCQALLTLTRSPPWPLQVACHTLWS